MLNLNHPHPDPLAGLNPHLSDFQNIIYRGKGDNYRLGHGTEEHIRLPKQIERFNGKKVKDISVGSMHCLAVTDDGEVYGWGRNEQGQLGDMTIQCRTEPTRLPGLEGKNIVGAACGPSQVKKLKVSQYTSYLFVLNFWFISHLQFYNFRFTQDLTYILKDQPYKEIQYTMETMPTFWFKG